MSVTTVDSLNVSFLALDQLISSRAAAPSSKKGSAVRVPNDAILEAALRFSTETEAFNTATASASAVAKALFADQLVPLATRFADHVTTTINPVFITEVTPGMQEIDKRVTALMEQTKKAIAQGTRSDLTEIRAAREEGKNALARATDTAQRLGGFSPELEVIRARAEQTLTDVETQIQKLDATLSPTATANVLTELTTLITSSSAIDQTASNTGLEANFSQAFRNALDGEVYKLSKGDRKGARWGFEHRYDDLGTLRTAFANVASRTFVEQLDKPESPLAGDARAQQEIFVVAHKSAGSPATEDLRAWARGNIAFHIVAATKTCTTLADKRKADLAVLTELSGYLSTAISDEGKKQLVTKLFKTSPGIQEAVNQEVLTALGFTSDTAESQPVLWKSKEYQGNLIALQIAVDAVIARGGRSA